MKSRAPDAVTEFSTSKCDVLLLRKKLAFALFKKSIQHFALFPKLIRKMLLF